MRSLVYQNRCTKREKEGHKNKYKQSHLTTHSVTTHQECQNEVLNMFTMRVVKVSKAALQRQVREAVDIASSHHTLLNSK